MDFVALVEQEFREVATVLSGDAGDESFQIRTPLDINSSTVYFIRLSRIAFRLSFPKVGVSSIAVVHNSLRRQRPIDTKRRITPTPTAVGFRPVKLRHLIEHFGIVFKSLI